MNGDRWLEAMEFYGCVKTSSEWLKTDLRFIGALRTKSVKETYKSIAPKFRNFVENDFSEIDPRMYANTLILSMRGHDTSDISNLLGVDSEWVRKFQAEVGFQNAVLEMNPDIRKEDKCFLALTDPTKGYDINVTMGTTPSGDLTLANVYTIAAGVSRVSEMCKEHGFNPTFSLGINDNAIHPSQQKYLEHRLDVIDGFVNDFREVTGIEIDVVPFSRIQRESRFREMLNELNECGQLGFGRIEIKRARKGKQKFKTLCNTDVDYLDPRFDYSGTIYALVSLRANYAKSAIHIIGGDQEHAHKVFNPDKFPGQKPPAVYSPGLVYGTDGQEMHVSNGNIVSYTELGAGPKTIESVLEMAQNPSEIVGPANYWRMISEEKRDSAYQSKAKGNTVKSGLNKIISMIKGYEGIMRRTL